MVWFKPTLSYPKLHLDLCIFSLLRLCLDLYHAWVAPTLQSDLLVQFWQRSRGVLKSDCSQGWTVLDVEQLAPAQRFTYKATKDHSKWAVSSGPDTSGAAAGGRGGSGGWVCVGDINRDQAEELRGGGTVCLRDPAVWKAYRTAAVQCYSCRGDVSECDTALRGAVWQRLHMEPRPSPYL